MADQREVGARIGRRSLLKASLSLSVAAGLAALRLREVQAQAVPKDLPPHIAYFPEAAESSTGTGETTFRTDLSEGGILVATAQRLRLGGVDYDIDATHNPDRTIVFAVGAQNNISSLEFTTFPGVAVWKGREKTERGGFFERRGDFVTAGQVQVDRSRIPGNCTPQGCNVTRLVVLEAQQDFGFVRLTNIHDQLYFR